jgi:hypothetical protein
VTDDEMKCLLENTIDLQNKNMKYESGKFPESKMNAPISNEELARFEYNMRLRSNRIPPSFRQFLKICNGIKSYISFAFLSLRSTDEIIRYADTDRINLSEFSPLNEFVFASAEGHTSAFVAFDKSRIDEKGEMKVVAVAADGYRIEYIDFEDFIMDNYKSESVLNKKYNETLI